MKALVPIANGSEEIEASSIIDTLRRAEIEVDVAAVGGNLQVTLSRRMMFVGDCLIDECTGPYDVIALPGGMPGAENLAACDRLSELIKEQAAAGRLVAAICAAPAVVLKPLGILESRKATAYPGFSDQLDPAFRSDERVVIDGNIITSRGPGTAIEFALAIVSELIGPAQAEELGKQMLIK